MSNIQQYSGHLCYSNQLGKWRNEVLQLELYNKRWHYWECTFCKSLWSCAFICFSVSITKTVTLVDYLPISEPSILTSSSTCENGCRHTIFTQLPSNLLFCLQKWSVQLLSEDRIPRLRSYWKYVSWDRTYRWDSPSTLRDSIRGKLLVCFPYAIFCFC